MSDAWEVLESATEYETGWYDGGYDRVRQPDGSEKQYYWAALAPAVVVVGIVDSEHVRDEHVFAAESGSTADAGESDGDHDGSADADDEYVVFVEQYRPTVRETQRELVAGIVDEHGGDPADPGEPDAYEAAAKRELAEETGYVADDVSLLESYAVATGVLRHRRGIAVATGLTRRTRSRRERVPRRRGGAGSRRHRGRPGAADQRRDARGAAPRDGRRLLRVTRPPFTKQRLAGRAAVERLEATAERRRIDRRSRWRRSTWERLRAPEKG